MYVCTFTDLYGTSDENVHAHLIVSQDACIFQEYYYTGLIIAFFYQGRWILYFVQSPSSHNKFLLWILDRL